MGFQEIGGGRCQGVVAVHEANLEPGHRRWHPLFKEILDWMDMRNNPSF
jgi:hypothetical protein